MTKKKKEKMNALLSVKNKNEPACKRKKGEDVKHLNRNERMFLFLQFGGPWGNFIFKQIWYQYL